MISKIISLLVFIIIICIVIGWHELGHLLVAKKCNVYCYEYSIGFGPVLYKKKNKETDFVIRAIPLGGFVRMAGEDGEDIGEEVKDNDSNLVPKDRILANISKPKKIGVLAAGGIMNMILAVMCFYVYIAFSGGFGTIRDDGRIQVIENSIAYEAGLPTGADITHVETFVVSDGTSSQVYNFDIEDYSDLVTAFDYAKPTKAGDVQTIKFTYTDLDKSVKTLSLDRTGYLTEENEFAISKIGVGQYYDFYKYNFFSAIWGSWHLMGETLVGTLKAFGKIFAGDMSNLSGLVGIYETVDTVTEATTNAFGLRLINYIYLAGAISFSLGFFNLIPFPALDGGRIIFVLYSLITKKKVNANVEATIHFVGIILLFALMIFINIKDIINLFTILGAFIL